MSTEKIIKSKWLAVPADYYCSFAVAALFTFNFVLSMSRQSLSLDPSPKHHWCTGILLCRNVCFKWPVKPWLVRQRCAMLFGKILAPLRTRGLRWANLTTPRPFLQTWVTSLRRQALLPVSQRAHLHHFHSCSRWVANVLRSTTAWVTIEIAKVALFGA